MKKQNQTIEKKDKNPGSKKVSKNDKIIAHALNKNSPKKIVSK